MRLFTHRVIGLLLVTAVLVLVSAPVTHFDALGQDSVDPGTVAVPATEAAAPTSIPESAPTDPPAVEAPPTEAVAPTEAIVDAAPPVESAPTEPAPVEQTPAPPSATHLPTEAAPPASATSTVVAPTQTAAPTEAAVQAASIEIQADLSVAACGNGWRFSITGLTAETAPATIAAIFQTAGTVQIPLFFNTTSGVAFYPRSSGLDDTVLSASATVPDDFAGVFQLDTKGCLADATATPSVTPSSQFAEAVMTSGACGTAWSFQITGIESPVSAPANITVFEGGADFSMSLQQPQTGAVATYTRSDLNAFTLDRATVRISSAWNGTFSVLTFPCADFTPSPTATTTPVSQIANANPAGAVCGDIWRFEITGIEPPIVAPQNVTLFTSSGDFSVSQSSIVGTTAFYERGGLPPDFTFVSATVRISSAWDGEFSLLTFPCEATATTTSSPSSTSTATVTPTATLSGIDETISARIDLDACEQNSDLWVFELSNTINPGAFPLTITANFTGDSGVTVPRLASGVIDGAFVALYSWDQNLGDTLESATADVDAGIDYEFVLLSGPACADPATLTPTTTSTVISRVTLTPSQTETATASATATSSATVTPANTVTATNSSTATSTATATSRAMGTSTATPIRTATASATPTLDPTQTVWPTHTPRPVSPEPGPSAAPGTFPVTGSGPERTEHGLVLLLAIAGLTVLGWGVRRARLT